MKLDDPVSQRVIDGLATIQVPSIRRPRARVMQRLDYGAVPGYVPIVCDLHDPLSYAAGEKARTLRDLPVPEQGESAKIRAFVSKLLDERVKGCVEVPDLETVLRGESWNEVKKQQYRDAFAELRGQRPSMREASKVDGHGKREYYVKYKFLRCIHARNLKTRSWMLPRIHAIEDVVYHDKLNWPEFVKGTSVGQRVDCINSLRHSGMYYYESDYKAFESHMTPQVIRNMEGQMYERFLGDEGAFITRVLSGRQRISFRNKVKVELSGGRMSGDCSTSVSNGFNNMCLIRYVVQKKGGYCDVLVEGDDGLIASSVPLFDEDFLSLGFTISLKRVNDPSEASFCGLTFGPDGQVLRDPRKFFLGFGWTHAYMGCGHAIKQRLTRAKALSALAETPHCPIIGVMAHRALELTRGFDPLFIDDGFHVARDERSVVDFAPTVVTRELFAHVYGISIETQLLVESLIRNDQLDSIQQIIEPTFDQIDFSLKSLVVS